MTNSLFAEKIQTSLKLTLPVVAVAFSDSIADGIEHFDGEAVPAGCSFWQLATTRLFATSVSDHALCSIGVHTHNFADAPASQASELQVTLQAMTGVDYVREAEIGEIPVMPKQYRHSIYGPLAEFPLATDVALLFADAAQSLKITEAVARVDGQMPPAMGRPACAAIPHAIQQGKSAMSLGCCGARTYLDLLDQHILMWALPGVKLADYAEQLDTMIKANALLTRFHESRKSEIHAGNRPSVSKTLKDLAS